MLEKNVLSLFDWTTHSNKTIYVDPNAVKENVGKDQAILLKEEAVKSGLISEKEYEKIVDPRKMIKPY